ncbi:MAG TPA: hypothetical protein VJ732_07245 [Bryobacteraceae bacterium]|nr:hypothetical protein [Bryobacteraceae bacterium]
MLIDWFTVAAQILNFLALVWLLKRFLYGRILGAIDAREKRIAAAVEDAQNKQREADNQLAQYQANLRSIQQQHEALLEQARADAENQHATLVDQARRSVQALEIQWREDLERERRAFLFDLRRRAATEIFTIAGRAVADLASADLQQGAIHVFLEKIRVLDGADWKALSDGTLSVRSAFDVPEPTRAEVQRVLEERLGSPVRLQFDRDRGLGWGVELRGAGRRIGWTLETYMEDMEQDLKEMLDRTPEPAAHVELT